MPKVFEATSIAGMKLKNRIIRSATHEGLVSDNELQIEKLMNLYVNLAKGGVGAIITGYAGVQNNGKAVRDMRMFDHDKYISIYERVNHKMKEYGTPLILQLAHGGGQTSKTITGEDVVAPSRIKYPLFSSTARELSVKEIEQIINCFVEAIVRAQRANFDGVQLHAGHGYLLSEFLSPHMNRRNDRWGGNTENRFRIIEEIVYRARQMVGNFPILMKFSAYDGDKNGVRIEEAISIAQLFQKASGDAIEVSCGGITDGFSTVRMNKVSGEAILHLMPQFKDMALLNKMIVKMLIPFFIKTKTPLHNYNVSAATKIKENVNIPVIVVGGIRRISDIETIINEQKADYVSMCRPFIIESDIVKKFQNGQQKESRCINCGYCAYAVGNSTIKCYYGKLPV